MVEHPGRDERLMSLMELALAIPEDDREPYLRVACEDDPGLFREVTERLEWERKMNGFLLQPLLPRTEPERPFKPGDLALGRFEIVREIAEGGMAIVYEAFDQKLERRIAIKCPKPGFRRRLPPELRNALEVSHPNICRLYEIHTASTDAGEVEFLTMELLEGETLLERIRRVERIPAAEAAIIARQICLGLAEAHRKGVVHGDLKPGNVIITKDPNDAIRAVITDFGLAQPVSEISGPTAAAQSRFRGTPDFIAPELWKGSPITPASDIYALGVMLYELISGRRPFEGRPASERIGVTPVAPGKVAPGVPRAWDRAVTSCLAPETSARPSSAAEVAALLQEKDRTKWIVLLAAALSLLIAAFVFALRPEAPPAVLTVMDLDSDGESAVYARGVMVDVSRRLTALGGDAGRKVRVIMVDEGDRIDVRRPEQAVDVFGATHALTGRIRHAGGRFTVDVAVLDLKSRQNLRELHSDYSRAEIGSLPGALTSMVAATFDIRTKLTAATISQPAYPDYVQGLSLLKSDLDAADSAIVSFSKAIAADPDSALPYSGLAEAQRLKWGLTNDRSWLERAEESAAKALARNPDSPETLLVLGKLKVSRGAYAEAAAAFRRALALAPNHPDAHVRMAEVQREAGQIAEAARSYETAIQLQPGYYRPYFDYAVFLSRLGRYQDAIVQLETLTRIAPRMRSARYELGRSYLESGRLSDAEREFRTAIAIRESWAELVGLAAVSHLQGRFRDAATYYERAMKTAPVSANLLANMGDAYRLSGRPADSASAYAKALASAENDVQTNPRNGFHHAMLGYAAARTGDGKRAVFETTQAVALAQKDTRVQWRAVATLEALGRREESLRLLQNAPKSLLDDLSRQPDLSALVTDPRFIQLKSLQN